MTLEEACDKLREHLRGWYSERIKTPGFIRHGELYDAVEPFLKANPEVNAHREKDVLMVDQIE